MTATLFQDHCSNTRYVLQIEYGKYNDIYSDPIFYYTTSTYRMSPRFRFEEEPTTQFGVFKVKDFNVIQNANLPSFFPPS
jgi:hypothetical protein